MRGAIGTNLLVYAEGLNAASKREQARELLRGLAGRCVLPSQVAVELYNVLLRKGHWLPSDALASVTEWCELFPLADSSSAATMEALALAAGSRIVVWDAIVLASAARSQCQVLLSEDLQANYHWRGVTVVNPFAAPAHPLLQALLAGD